MSLAKAGSILHSSSAARSKLFSSRLKSSSWSAARSTASLTVARLAWSDVYRLSLLAYLPFEELSSLPLPFEWGGLGSRWASLAIVSIAVQHCSASSTSAVRDATAESSCTRAPVNASGEQAMTEAGCVRWCAKMSVARVHRCCVICRVIALDCWLFCEACAPRSRRCHTIARVSCVAGVAIGTDSCSAAASGSSASEGSSPPDSSSSSSCCCCCCCCCC